ncbi:MAG: M3 family metallopeptidase [Ottowia sp.]|nr:M3 family metallopeptidase [Ottowia sp.]
MNLLAHNPLLDFSTFPRFSDIQIAHISPALTQQLGHAQQAIKHICDDNAPPNWENIVAPLDAVIEPLSQTWTLVSHLSMVMDTPEIRAAHAENLPRITEFFSSLGQNLALYQRYKALANSSAFSSLNVARKKVIENALRDFRLGGAELNDADKLHFAAIQTTQATLSKEFSDHILDATNHYHYTVTDEAELAGLPADVIAAARATAKQNQQVGWQFTLQFPSYFPVMQHADNRALRERLYRAYVTRASELGPEFAGAQHDWDNAHNMVEQIKLRQEEAAMLGFRNYAELSLASKMADTPQQVHTFLTDMAQRARPYAQRDWETLTAFSKDTLGLSTLAPWDIAYASEKLRQHHYAFSEEALRPYFCKPQVLSGLFDLAEKLFDIRITEKVAQTWHPDVKFYQIESMQGQPIAHFYLDLYARIGKQNGAWMNDARARKLTANGHIQTPIAYLTCNFPPPLEGRPALLSHNDVITLFHEFGHGLHHMLTHIEEYGVSGINGVEWDAVELPSQMLENFCWEWEVLQKISGHVETGEPLPHAIYKRMLAAKNFQKGLATLRQVVFSLFDLTLHTEFTLHPKHTPQATGNAYDGKEDNNIAINNPSSQNKHTHIEHPAHIDGQAILSLAQHIHQRIHVIPQASFSRWPHSFSHIFAGGYAAGYYSYKWAEVLSADVYALFEEAAAQTGSVINNMIGMRYYQEILRVGGSRPAIESFRAFRGREPDISALLRHDEMTT